MYRTEDRGGFTLIEFMITIAVIGLIAAIAIPSYQNSNRKSYYAEVTAATAPYRAAIGTCVQNLGTLIGCNAGMNGIPPAITTPMSAVASLTVVNGVITVTPVPAQGVLTTDTYILTPSVDVASGTITWVASGGGVMNGYTQ